MTIKVTQYAPGCARVIATSEVDTLEQAHAFLNALAKNPPVAPVSFSTVKARELGGNFDEPFSGREVDVRVAVGPTEV